MINVRNFTDIFRFTKIYEKSKSSINKHDPWGVFATQALEGIRRDLSLYIANEYEAYKFDVTCSQGGPSMPRVPWVAVTASRTRVSTALSYTICFGRQGNGVVHGLMLPALYNLKNLEPIIRTTQDKYIDIDGTKADLKYNNRYVNPEELLASEIDEYKIIKHMKECLKIIQGSI